MILTVVLLVKQAFIISLIVVVIYNINLVR